MKWVVNSEFINNYTHFDSYSHTHPSQLISYPTKEKQELLTDDMKKKFSRCIFFFIICDNERKNCQLYCNLFRWQKENEKYTKTLGVREEWNVKDRRMCRFPKDYKDRYAYIHSHLHTYSYIGYVYISI